MTKISEQSIINQIPSYIFWKDRQGKTMGGNKLYIKAAGFQSLTELIGKTDYELPWAKYADEYRYCDKEVLKGLTLSNYVEYNMSSSGTLRKVIVNKKPLVNQANEIVGIVGTFNVLAELPKDIMENINALPLQQKLCLNYTINGLSAKQIAAKMHLSSRTIEFYLKIIKDKFNCKNKAELIMKAALPYYNRQR